MTGPTLRAGSGPSVPGTTASGRALRSGPPSSKAPQHPFLARSMLPSVERFTQMAQNMMGTSVTAGHALKRSLVALGEAQRQQSLRGI